MYSHNYIIPNNSNSMYRNNNDFVTYDNTYSSINGAYPYTENGDERFFLTPFLVGGLAGTALGYGIANNNQINNNNNNCCQPMMMWQPIWQPMWQPMNQTPFTVSSSSTSSNNNYFY